MKLAFLVRCVAVGVEFVHALVAGVGQQLEALGQRQAGVLEEGKVVRFACGDRHAHDAAGAVIDHELAFLGVALLLAGVEAALFFWGRSMRCSLASTTTTSNFNEPSYSAFLPGR